MQQSVTAAPSSTAASFASLLSALIAPKPKTVPQYDAGWNDGLADDVATLSYERALSSHARYRASDIVHDRSLTQSTGSESIPIREASLVMDTQFLPLSRQVVSDSETEHEAESAGRRVRQDERKHEQNRKTASVTVRLSKPEYAQMHQRAAEAGMTVSAYLRSCTFEAESLRTQVKEALAQLRSAASSENPAAVPKGAQMPRPPANGTRFKWLRMGRLKQLFPRSCSL